MAIISDILNTMADNVRPENLDESLNQTHSGRLDPTFYPRPILSTIDTFDQNTQIDYGHSATSVGRRPSWNVPSIAVTSESINTIRASASTKFQSPSVTTVAGMTKNPATTISTEFRAVPNMRQVLKTDSNAHISFSLNVRTAAAPDRPIFAIFRDNVQISQYYYVTASTAGSDHPLNGTYIDTNPQLRKYHTYDLRWRAGSSRVTSLDTFRTLQASNLRAI